MIKINLLCKNYIDKDLLIAGSFIYCVIFVFIAAFFYGINGQVYALKKKIQVDKLASEKKLEVLSKKIEENKKLSKKKVILEENLKKYITSQDKKKLVVELLNYLYQNLSEKIWLEEVEIVDLVATVKGYVLERKEISDFVTNLSLTKIFQSVQINNLEEVFFINETEKIQKSPFNEFEKNSYDKQEFSEKSLAGEKWSVRIDKEDFEKVSFEKNNLGLLKFIIKIEF